MLPRNEPQPYRNPLVPWQSRFPVGSGLISTNPAPPSGAATRPLGLWRASATWPIELGKHEKKPTKVQTVVSRETGGDGNGEPPKTDTAVVTARD